MILGNSTMDGNRATVPDDTGRLFRLDGLRGIAAAGVLTHHIFLFYAPWQFSAAPFAQVAGWIQRYGWTLVDLFFVLSGYVFAQVYLRDETLRSQKGLASFWVARFARLWPLHLTMLVLIAIVHPANQANTVYAFLAHLAMLQAFVIPVAGTYDGSTWSITVEVLCYAIFATFYAHGRRALLWTTALMIGLALISQTLISHPGGPFAGSVFRRGLLGFFLGQALWHCRGRLSKIPMLVLAASLLAGLWIEVGPYSPVLPLTLLTWPSALLLALRLKVMESPAMVWLGDRSYGIYLINLPLIQAVASICEGHELGTTRIVTIQLAIVVMALLAAELSFRWIEAPSRRAIRQVWKRHEGRSSESSGTMTRTRGSV